MGEEDTKEPENAEATDSFESEISDLLDLKLEKEEASTDEIKVDDDSESTEDAGKEEREAGEGVVDVESTTIQIEAAKEEPEKVSKEEYNKLTEKLAALEARFAGQIVNTQVPVVQPAVNQTPLIDQSDLINLLSGEVDRAGPVIEKFVNTVQSVIFQNIVQAAAQQKQMEEYAEANAGKFYNDNKDLIGNEKLVKMVYDSYCLKNPNIKPHEFLDDVAKSSRELIKAYKQETTTVASKKEAPVRRIVTTKGGESSSIRTPSAAEGMTELEQEMLDLLN